mgnify:CR=1 FL=1
MNEITQWIFSNGISKEVLEILIFIPIIATIINISRYIIGFKSFGIYAPVVLAISYHFTGLRYGLFITIVVAISSIIGYNILKKVRMHYLSRIAVNYILSIIVLIISILAIQQIPFIGMNNFQVINPIAIVSIVALTDFFTKMYIKKNIMHTLRVLLETIIIAIAGWILISIPNIINLIVNNLWILIVVAIANILIGSYSGLRFKEIFRFWSAVNYDNRDSKKN